MSSTFNGESDIFCVFSNEYTTLKGIIRIKVATMVYFKLFFLAELFKSFH